MYDHHHEPERGHRVDSQLNTRHPADGKAGSSGRDAGTTNDDLLSLLLLYPTDDMSAYPIHPRVGSPKYDDPVIIKPLNETSL